MTRKEKGFYHQIHPAKLTTDILSDFAALYLFWQHQLFLGIIVLLVPAVFVSVILINFVDLEKLKESKFGKYFRENVNTKTAGAGRIAGAVVSVIGAWFHLPVLIVLGILAVVFAWTKALIFKR